jgi:hypothetical protein
MCKTLAASCLVVPAPPGASIKPDGTTKEELEINEAKALPDCSRLALVSGSINVLYETSEGLKRKPCKAAGQCEIHAGTWPSWLDTARTHARAGGKRMDKEVSRLPGIPHGRIFSMEKAATFHMARAELSQWHLSLSDASNKKLIYRQGGSDRVVQVPTNLLRTGGKYTVAIEGSSVRYKGGFDILGGAEAAEITKEIKQVNSNTGVTARERKLDELIVLYENNLDYEVELLREELQL